MDTPTPARGQLLNSVESVQRPPATIRGGEAAEPDGAARRRASGRAGLYWLPVATLIIGLLVTGALVLVSHSQYVSNEKRLLNLRVRDASAILGESVPGHDGQHGRRPREQADATNGNIARFQRLVSGQVGTQARAVLSLSLWKVERARQRARSRCGTPRQAGGDPRRRVGVPGRGGRTPTLSVIGLLKPPDLRTRLRVRQSGRVRRIRGLRRAAAAGQPPLAPTEHEPILRSWTTPSTLAASRPRSRCWSPTAPTCRCRPRQTLRRSRTATARSRWRCPRG